MVKVGSDAGEELSRLAGRKGKKLLKGFPGRCNI
jgi:hypothetical protein